MYIDGTGMPSPTAGLPAVPQKGRDIEIVLAYGREMRLLGFARLHIRWTLTDSDGRAKPVASAAWVPCAPSLLKARRGILSRSNPVAITVMRSPRPCSGRMTAPKIRFTSGCAVSRMIAAAWLTSNSVMLGPPVTLKSTPDAPSMVMLSSLLEMASSMFFALFVARALSTRP